ncbi:unnamed protein product [Brachionus calyciflorus]|uniref:DUF4832 domain-containing protein n=1 Tax=Brachionus calyciflorus TaxID=104777 RepID=A0A814PP66_9BILA|nr:unnamed protein product [Brachionus calyciflorus]
MLQIRTPFYKRNLFSNPNAITSSEAYITSNPRSRVGHHNDCFLASSDDYGTYEDISVEYPFLSSETLYLPMGGETCNPNPPRSS